MNLELENLINPVAGFFVIRTVLWSCFGEITIKESVSCGRGILERLRCCLQILNRPFMPITAELLHAAISREWMCMYQLITSGYGVTIGLIECIQLLPKRSG